MRVGLVAQYRRSESVRVAMRLADLFEGLDREVSVYSPGDRGLPNLKPSWDRRVVSGRTLTLAEWCDRQNAVVWVDAPPAEDVAVANQKGCKTVCMAPWGELSRHAEASLRFFDAVVCPNVYSARKVAQFHEVATHVVDWDCGVPVSRKDRPLGERVRILVPLHGSGGDRVEPARVAAMMSRLVAWCRWADVTVTLTPKNLPPGVLGGVKAACTAGSAGSISVLFDRTGFDLSPLVYGRHDLTVWPAEYDGYGDVPLTSLTMGTPVVAYCLPAAAEIVADRRNGILVEPEHELALNEEGLEDAITGVLTDANTLRGMTEHTRYLLDHRRMGFVQSWIRVLDG